MTKEYPLATGELDRARLEILDRLYSPVTKTFLIKNGLQAGMTVLDFGCGMGDMTCWFAQQVGSTGKVIALDISQDSLDIAKQKAEQKGLSNIEFVCMDIKDIESLGITFDFIYGKWVLMHVLTAELALCALYTILKKNGLFAYEAIDELGQGYFSYPELPVVNNWFDIGRRFFIKRGDIHYGKKLFFDFAKLGLHDINLQVNQPILTTPEEKSVLRLGLAVGKKSFCQNYSEAEYQNFVDELIAMEQSDTIVGFYRNIIAIGKK